MAAMKLFDFLDALFDKNKWKSVDNLDKRSNFFMTQRMCSAKYIAQAQALNVNNISKERVMDWWHVYLTNLYSRKAPFIFIKVDSKKEKEKDIFEKIKTETYDFFMKHNELCNKDIESLKKYFPQELLADLLVYQENL